MRLLHVVFNCRNLKRAVEFYRDGLGCRVLRHEEFMEGCEAQCNGPYQGHWSKTMIGPLSESESFVFELTCNYGVDNYPRANDLRHISVVARGKIDDVEDLSEPESFAAFRASNLQRVASRMGLVQDGIMCTPDGQVLRLCQVNDDMAPSKTWPIMNLSLRANNLDVTRRFYVDGLGMTDLSKNAEVRQRVGSVDQSLLVGFTHTSGAVNFDQCFLEFVESDSPIVHSPGSGRLAFECESPGNFDLTQFGGVVVKPLVTLPTPGKADVQVVILQDPNGYEICLVNQDGFGDLSRPFNGSDFINWDLRSKKEATIEKWNNRSNAN